MPDFGISLQTKISDCQVGLEIRGLANRAAYLIDSIAERDADTNAPS